MKRLSSYPEIAEYRRKHKGMRKVDWYRLRDRCVHIIHEGGCPRSMTADGLCSCLDPETYEIELDPSDVPGQRWA